MRAQVSRRARCERASRGSLVRSAVALAACAGALLPAAGSTQSTALTGGTVIDGTGAPPIEAAVVVVEGGRLACVGTRNNAGFPPGRSGWISPAGT